LQKKQSPEPAVSPDTFAQKRSQKKPSYQRVEGVAAAKVHLGHPTWHTKRRNHGPAQPAKKAKPPMGVNCPSHELLSAPSHKKLAVKMKMPGKSKHLRAMRGSEKPAHERTRRVNEVINTAFSIHRAFRASAYWTWMCAPKAPSATARKQSRRAAIRKKVQSTSWRLIRRVFDPPPTVFPMSLISCVSARETEKDYSRRTFRLVGAALLSFHFSAGLCTLPPGLDHSAGIANFCG